MRTKLLLSMLLCLSITPVALIHATPPITTPELALPPNDVLIAPPPATLAFATDEDLRLPSQYLAGRVAVRLVLPESNGLIDPSDENWTPDQIEQVVSETQAALDWWRERLPAARLAFDLVVQTVPTNYEPIRYGIAQEGLWISDVLRAWGYEGGNYIEQAYSAAFDLRDQRGADWATTIFIVNSARDDGYFADGRFAYAYLNGPFSVITSDGGPYTTRWLRAVIAHEFAHLFGALDQYSSANVSCDLRSGYLFAPTTNSMFNNCGTNEPSIMRELITSFTIGAVDVSARAQLGYRDSDGDGVIDVLDTTPTITLTATGQTLSHRPMVELMVRDLGYPSPVQPDVSINPIQSVEYRVGDSDWQLALPVDGAFDQTREVVQVELPLYDGEHVVEFRAVNLVGNVSAPIKQTFTISGLGVAPVYRLAPAFIQEQTLMVHVQAPPETQAVEVSTRRDFVNPLRLPYRSEIVLPLPNELVLSTFTHAPMLYVRFIDAAGLPSLVYALPIDLPEPVMVMIPLVLR
ncbi:MAG: hypothetical protein C0184_13275 [Chloroflexus aggregans]|uniref:Uncharacterized protein n=1 Tax=Chloroflexus aggregans TaxID=152260 RepID=A0A2J6WXU7_9CHLR|nr:MAG: hypothetical protein C0184_13275 [Chloroflexus aggregans]